MPRILPTSLAVVLAALSSSCARDGLQPGESYFIATLAGAVESDFRGDGWFSQGSPTWGGTTFAIYARGQGASQGETFSIRRYDGGRLPVGTYPLALVSENDATPHGIEARFTREDSLRWQYAADGGTITITRSAPGVVEGHFEFTGFRYCVRTPPDPSGGERVIEGPCDVPLTGPRPGAARITVTGSFATGPASTKGTPDLP